MNAIKEQSHLLLILGSILVVKFIFVPIMEWQDSKVIDIQLKKSQLSRYSYLLEQESRLELLKSQLTEYLTSAELRLLSSDSESVFELEKQQLLESLFMQFELETQNIGWQETVTLSEFGLIRRTMNVRLTGKVQSLMDLILAVEALEQKVAISNLSVQIVKQKQNQLGDFRGNVSFDFFVTDKNAV